MAGPVLDDLQKFHEIVLSHLFLWREESLEPLISFNRESYPISAICDLVASSDFAHDAWPDPLVNLLHIEARGLGDFQLVDQSYGAGAKYVHQVIRCRQKNFQSRPRG
jgi:hypothetical protein